jgi:glycosyltransferase involved in cell wall biosynthesis
VQSHSSPRIFLIGIQEGDHPGGGRFTAFHHHLKASFVGSPLKFRYLYGKWTWRLDLAISALTPRPHYSIGLLVMELAAGMHMLRHRKSVYHSVKGEVDLLLLPLLSRLTGTYLVATFHDGPEKLRYWKIGRRITRHLAGVIVLSETQRRYFEKLLPPERIFLVPHGVDTDLFRPADEPTQEPVAIAVGAYFRDYVTLAKAMQLVWEKSPRTRFILVGTRQADKWNPAPEVDDPRVDFLDGISDAELVRTYQASSVAIVSVIDATANNALLEAMACGLPVVATDVGAIKEYLGEEAGILCAPSDPQSLATGVLQVLADKSAARKMGAAGRARALNFDYHVVAEQLRDVYTTVTKLG